MTDYDKLDAWIDAHFDEEVAFLQALIQVPTDTPPGNNTPHADRTAQLLSNFGMQAEKHSPSEGELAHYGMQSITNLIVRRKYGAQGTGKTIALNAHGDVVPPGEGWTHDPYGGIRSDGSEDIRSWHATGVGQCGQNLWQLYVGIDDRDLGRELCVGAQVRHRAPTVFGRYHPFDFPGAGL